MSSLIHTVRRAYGRYAMLQVCNVELDTCQPGAVPTPVASISAVRLKTGKDVEKGSNDGLPAKSLTHTHTTASFVQTSVPR